LVDRAIEIAATRTKSAVEDAEGEGDVRRFKSSKV
jgi:hypothetical protein